MANDTLHKRAEEAIRALFSDTSVSVEVTRVNLETLVIEIETLLETLPDPEDKPHYDTPGGY